MALKNAYSDIPINRIFEHLQHVLATHGAKQITLDYGDDGKIHGLMFVIKYQHRYLPIKLPARLGQVRKLLEQQLEQQAEDLRRQRKRVGFTYDDEQVYRIA